MSEKHVSKLVNGEVQLTMDMARRLEMVLGPSAQFCPELVRILAARGVALVFLPHMKGSFLHGATFKDGRKMAILPSADSMN